MPSSSVQQFSDKIRTKAKRIGNSIAIRNEMINRNKEFRIVKFENVLRENDIIAHRAYKKYITFVKNKKKRKRKKE